MKVPCVALILTVMAASAVFALYHKVGVGGETVRIVSPRNGEALGGDSVTVRYQLNHPPANTSPVSYELRLDNNVPVHTEKSEYTFSQLSPGRHRVRLRLSGASGMASGTVNFSTSAAGGQGELPETGSALPLLSIIGFGVLLGGVASALKTRQVR